MGQKRRVVLVQTNYQYGTNVFVPYSAGVLQAHAQSLPEIRDDFVFDNPIFLRKDPAELVRAMEEPAVVGFSCYLWNWEYNKVVAQLVRERFPDCLIVFGGTHAPTASEGFFQEHPYVDLIVHHEGELAFADILLKSATVNPDYTAIPGLSVRVEGTRTFKTAAGGRIKDLRQLRSPYLDGVFDFLLDGKFDLNVSQETNRGCMYKCTFCDWGGNVMDKFHTMGEDRLLEEFEWFGRNKVEFLFNCDANYGLGRNDVELTRQMIKIRERHDGFPRKFRMCTAKNSDEKIFEIVKMLNDAGMNKGATLSRQSMYGPTLDAIERRNIKMEKFGSLMKSYADAGIATYTELIMGMPAETYESSKAGVDELLEGQEKALNLFVFICSMLPNSKMSTPEYMAKHGIKKVRVPLLLAHSTPDPSSIAEYQDVAVETNSMSKEDWQRTYLFYWAVQAFHCLGLLQHVAILFHKRYGLRYSDFYERLVEYFGAEPATRVGKEIAMVKAAVAEMMAGGRIDRVLPQFGDIYWPLEEASSLTLVANKAQFYAEVRAFIGALANTLNCGEEDTLLDDLVLYQSSMLKGPDDIERLIDFRYDLHGFFGRLQEPEARLDTVPSRLRVKPEKLFGGNLAEWAQEVVWYGRKGGSLHHRQVEAERLAV